MDCTLNSESIMLDSDSQIQTPNGTRAMTIDEAFELQYNQPTEFNVDDIVR